jgi:RNA polymerase sigma-70 factor (ECF subfamily)
MRAPRRTDDFEQLSDEELLAQYRTDGDPVWVGVLFERYTHLVFLVSIKYLKDDLEAEDMSMRIFEKLMSDLRKYDVQSFRHWLHTVVKNQCLLHLERQKRRREKTETFEADLRSRLLPELTPYAPDLSVDREAQLTLMEQSLTTLKSEQRVCLALFYLEEKSYQEVASQTGFTLKQVKSHIQNGKRMLRIQMDKQTNAER